MSVFKKGFNKVDRRVVIPGLTEAVSFPIPAGAYVSRVYAQNRSTEATNLTVGNVASGAQYLASVAVPVASNVTVPDERKDAAPGATVTVSRAGILYPRAAIALQPSKVDSAVHVTLSAYPTVGEGDNERGLVDVVIEIEELWDSLPIPSFLNTNGY